MAIFTLVAHESGCGPPEKYRKLLKDLHILKMRLASVQLQLSFCSFSRENLLKEVHLFKYGEWFSNFLYPLQFHIVAFKRRETENRDAK